MEDKKLSIITVTYKDPEGLARTLNSLAPLLGAISFELIVVDSSPDLNGNAIKSTKIPLMHLTSPAEGIYSAMNKGINAASGQYIWFLNGGDELNSKEALVNALSELTHRTNSILIADVEIWKHEKFSKIHSSSLPQALLGINSVCHQGVLYPRNAFISPYNTKYKITADYVHLLECQNRKTNIIKSNIVLAKYYKGGVSDNIIPALKEFWKVQWENPMCLTWGKRASHYFFLASKSLLIVTKRILSTLFQNQD